MATLEATVHQTTPTALTARAIPRRDRARRATLWLLAVAAVLLSWAFTRQLDGASVAHGATIPALPPVSDSAGSVPKRRPQLASFGTYVYAVWEESGANGDGVDLYFAWYDTAAATPAWSVPEHISSAKDAGRWAGAVNEWYPRIAVDPNGDLHVAYAQRNLSGTVQQSAYYIVRKNPTTSPPVGAWSNWIRIDPSAGGYLFNPDTIRIFVRDEQASVASFAGYEAIGYVLWTGNSGNKLNLTRVAYDWDTNTLSTVAPDGTIGGSGAAGPIVNPGNITAGPVAVLEQIATPMPPSPVPLQLVYASKNTTAGNNFFGAELVVNADATLTWNAHSVLVSNTAEDCSQNGCPGASATRDNASRNWVTANWDTSTAHRVQASWNSGSGPTSAFFDHPLLTARQPVVVHDPLSDDVLAMYTVCTYAGVGSCNGRDIYYRKAVGGMWGGAVPIGPTTGEQKDLTAIVVGGDLFYSWVGTNQDPIFPGDHVFFGMYDAP